MFDDCTCFAKGSTFWLNLQGSSRSQDLGLCVCVWGGSKLNRAKSEAASFAELREAMLQAVDLMSNASWWTGQGVALGFLGGMKAVLRSKKFRKNM